MTLALYGGVLAVDGVALKHADGSLFPWRGNLLVGGLSSKALIRLTLDGALLVITDDRKSELLRLTPP